MQVARFDRGMVKKAVVTDEGYLQASAIVTRTGVFTYVNPDGTIRNELRHPNDVFKTDSLESIKLKPITYGHPSQRLVDSRNFKELSIGYTGESVNTDGNFIVASMVITDNQAVSDIQAGKKRELSLGYTVDLVKEDGIYEGQSYTHRQTNIKYNHLAVVDRARAGSSARIHLDRNDAEEIIMPTPKPNESRDTFITRCMGDAEAMKTFADNDQRLAFCNSVFDRKDSLIAIDSDILNNLNEEGTKIMDEKFSIVTLDSLEYKAAPEVANAFKKFDAIKSELNVKIDSLTAELEKMKAEKDELSTKLDAAVSVDHEANLKEAVKARVNLISKANELLGSGAKEINMDEMSDKEIKVSIIKVKRPKVNLDNASDTYIEACFDLIVEDSSEVKSVDSEGLKKQREALSVKADAKEMKKANADEAYKAYVDRLKNGYKKDNK